MTVVRIKGFKIFRDRHGRERCYHRKTGLPIDLQKHPRGSPEFLAECARIGALVSTTAPKPGTLGLLIQAYRAHPAFSDLAPRTRADYQSIFNDLQPIADTPLVKFDKPLVVRIRDKAASKGRVFANHLKALLSVVFGWGAERGYVAANPASGIKYPTPQRPARCKPALGRRRARGDACWRPAPYLAAHCVDDVLRTWPKDALTLPRTFYKAGEIATRRSKTGEPVFWLCPAPLAAILEAAPTHNAVTLCANSDGRPWTVSGFRTRRYSITSSARPSSESGTVIPIALALFKFRNNSTLVDSCTGRSPGFSHASNIATHMAV